MDEQKQSWEYQYLKQKKKLDEQHELTKIKEEILIREAEQMAEGAPVREDSSSLKPVDVGYEEAVSKLRESCISQEVERRSKIREAEQMAEGAPVREDSSSLKPVDVGYEEAVSKLRESFISQEVERRSKAREGAGQQADDDSICEDNSNSVAPGSKSAVHLSAPSNNEVAANLRNVLHAILQIPTGDNTLHIVTLTIKFSMWGSSEAPLKRVYNSVRDAGIPLPEYVDHQTAIDILGSFLLDY
eukprot:5312_1